ncbi:MAG: hypothetical protein A2X45_07755 [Lentisphaerae bacterium GWF2_50_93]|nr:MAG: hypothetical protein A2X45_07755 [Lentisphaerae bacterium GWF2_50_93]
MSKAKTVSRKKIASGKWLSLEKISYVDHYGSRRDWECSTRIRSRGAVAIIAILKPSGRIMLVRQFRPPSDGWTIEFPAGLIDRNEKPGTTARRELYEETGYSGKVTGVGRPLFSSPGMSGETVHLVRMEIKENAPENRDVKTSFDDGEHLETFLVPLKELMKFLEKSHRKGDRLDAKVVCFATGMNIQYIYKK